MGPEATAVTVARNTAGAVGAVGSPGYLDVVTAM